jgi:tetratricopeptide (TPR) repeat protein
MRPNHLTENDLGNGSRRRDYPRRDARARVLVLGIFLLPFVGAAVAALLAGHNPIRRYLDERRAHQERIEHYQKQLRDAESALAQERFNEAIQGFMGARDLFSTDEPEWQTAEQSAQEARQKRQAAYDQLWKEAQAAEAKRDFEAASKCFRSARDLFEADIEAAGYLAAHGAAEAAIERSKQLPRFNEFFKAAEAAMEAGDYKKALSCFASARALLPDDAELCRRIAYVEDERREKVDQLIAKANSALAKEKFQLAIEAAQQAQAIDDSRSEPKELIATATRARRNADFARARDVGLTKLKAGNLDAAISHLELAHRLDSANAEVRTAIKEAQYRLNVRRAEKSLALGDYTQCKGAADCALAARPNDVQAEILLREARAAIEHGELRRTSISNGADIASLAFSQSDCLVIATLNGRVYRWSWREKTLPSSLPRELPKQGGDVTRATLSKNGRLLALSERQGIVVTDLDLGGKPVALPDSQGDCRSLQFADHNRYLAAGFDSREIAVWSLGKNFDKVLKRTSTAAAGSLSFSADGGLLASGQTDGRVIVFSIPAGNAVIGRNFPFRAATALGFSADSRAIAVAGETGIVQGFDVGNGKLVQSYDEHRHQVNCLAFSPDGQWMITGSSDRTVGRWQRTSDTSRALPRFAGHASEVVAVAFDSAEEVVATASRDGMVKVWSLGEWSKRAP